MVRTVPSQVYSDWSFEEKVEDLKILNDKIRNCYICGRTLDWNGFIKTAKTNGTIKKFKMKTLREIWRNDIFILKCCGCFKGGPYAVMYINNNHTHLWIWYPGQKSDNYQHYRTCRQCGLSLWFNDEIRSEAF